MGLSKPKDPPDTVSDKDWRKLQDRAREANPDLDNLTSERAIERRKMFARQHERRTQN